MGTCSSAPRLNVSLRTFMASNRPAEGLGEDWYFDTMNVLLDRWAHSHVQFLRKKFLEATGDGEKELDKKGFFSLFAELQDMPKSVAESAFRMFDTDNSGKLNFREFCCALALCCQLMSSDDEKIRFVFDMFDTNDDGLLSGADVHQLLEHALPREEEKYLPTGALEADFKDSASRRQQHIADIKQELSVTSHQLAFDRFYEWAIRNMDCLNNLLCTFQIVPSPDRERAICEDILNRHPNLQEGSTWYCISHKWLQVWKAHVGWTGPSPGRRIPSLSGILVPPTSVGQGAERERTRDRVYSGDSQLSLPLDDSPRDREVSLDDCGSEEIFLSNISNHQNLSARPPEIDNSDLEGEHKGELKMNLVEHLDYELIPEEMWLRLVEWYGGGPAIPRKVICMGQDNQPQVELYPPLVLVVVAGKNGQPLPQFSRRFFISRQSTLGETLSMLAEKLSKPADRSRLWHRAKGEQWRLVQQQELSSVLDEFLEGKVWDAGAIMLETQTETSEWPRDQLTVAGGALGDGASGEAEADEKVERAEEENVAAALQAEQELQRHFEVGDRVEAQSGVTGHWMRGTIVDVVLRDQGSTPSQVKVHYDSTVYKCDEWINTSSDRLAPFGTHTGTQSESSKAAEGDMSSPMRGATGLQNLGNTCFMNATIQCMVNTPLVREYFLSSQYLRDVNERGTSCCKGRLAQEFGQVMSEVWAGKSMVLSPRNLKRTIDQFAPQFAGYEQHDAQELLDFVLEGLHEDLNRTQGGTTKSLVSMLRREQGTPKLFSSTKPLLGRRGEGQSPKRAKAVWQRSSDQTLQDGSRASQGSPDEYSEPISSNVSEASAAIATTADVAAGATMGSATSAGSAEESSPWTAFGFFSGSALLGGNGQAVAEGSSGTLEVDEEESRTLEEVDEDQMMPSEEHQRSSSMEYRSGTVPHGQTRTRPSSSRSNTKVTQEGYGLAARTGRDIASNAAEAGREASPGVMEEQMPGPNISQPGLHRSPQVMSINDSSPEEAERKQALASVAAHAAAQTDVHSLAEAAEEDEEPMVPSEPSAQTEPTSIGGITLLPPSSNDWSLSERNAAQAASAAAHQPQQTESRGSFPSSSAGAAASSGQASLTPPPRPAKGSSSKMLGSSRWWSFAWQRGRGALDLPKDTTCEPAAPDSGAGSKEMPAAAAPLREVPQEGGLSLAVGPSVADDTLSSASSVSLRGSSKTPSGSAGAAVVAARRGEETPSEDGMSAAGASCNESEDFVPELLTPQRATGKRGRSIFGWRRRKTEEDLSAPGTPRRRPKTPPTMMPLREEQGEAAGEEHPRPGSAETTTPSREVAPADGTWSFLPWRGSLRSREGSLERAPDEGKPAPAREAVGAGRVGRAKDKDASLFPAFLRRAKSRENSSRRGRGAAPRAAPMAHQGDSPVADSMAVTSLLSDCEGDPLSPKGASGTAPGETARVAPLPSDAKGEPLSPTSGTAEAKPSEVAKAPPGPGDAKAASDRSATSGKPLSFFRVGSWGGKRDASAARNDAGPAQPAASPAKESAGRLAGGQEAPQDSAGNPASAEAVSPDMLEEATPQAPIQSTACSLPIASVQAVQPQNDTTPKDPAEKDEVDEDKLPDDEKAVLQWERHRARNRSLIVDVFEGQLRSQLKCCRCGHASSTFEPFRYLSIPIPSNHMDRCVLRVVYFPVPSSPGERPQLTRYSVTVPKSSTVQRVQMALSHKLPVPMSSVLLAEVYRSRIHRYLDPNLPLSDVRAEDQLFAFEVLQKTQDLIEYQERLAPNRLKKDRIEDPSKNPQPRVLMIQAMHRRVVDVCRSDGRTWSQRREVFGLPFVMSAASSWSYATLHEMLMIHAGRFLNHKGQSSSSTVGQVPFVARIVNASGTACGACDRRNCTGCLLPKGSARLRLRAGLLTGAASTAKIYLALDWVDSSVYDQAYVDNLMDDSSVAKPEVTPEETVTEAEESGSVPLNACVDAFAQAEYLKVENGNGVKCEKCEVVVDAEKKIEVWREPDVLLLHIKRFHFSGEHFEKISTPVNVPAKDLDIRPWIVGPSGASSTTYDLYGVACHRGGMSGGHYTSYCMNEGGKEPTWLKFNDETVTRVSLEQEIPEISKQCYVLFYRKRAFSSSNMINYLSL
eukprot:TRINITY_DN35688_c0_g1_i2.p1 TRINITY_DN35688_c0_g1~~TRINITY_DN35688_c0_g1_i2.p1  ORF type:complete len:2117 (+),score=462.65 TRINITY_DN35688_c0_g1_i2:173-6523(+)